MSKTLIFNFLFLVFSLQQLLSQPTSNARASKDPQKEFVMKQREIKDTEFKTPGSSPLPKTDIPAFKGLKYFPYNAKFCVKAKLEKIKDPKTFRMKTTTDRRPEYRTYAIAKFTVNGKPCQLTIYQPVDLIKQAGLEKYLFLPFTDETSGRETYGGGRFIELSIPDDDNILIDFNTAYNPYCAYNHTYSCPVPPEENDLNVKIEAGELPLYDFSKH
jgi:uncharacterized protein